jgi:hypothetical protein
VTPRTDFYVYEHIRPDTGQVFYVGKGRANRAEELSTGRNKHHRHITKKMARLGLRVEVVFIARDIPEESALLLEVMRIAMWRAARIPIVNLTLGGEGVALIGDSAALRDISGQRYNRLTAIEHIKKSSPTKWLFQCDCGTKKEIVAVDVTRDKVLSCGCHRNEVTVARSSAHLHSRKSAMSPTYNSWASMRKQCLNTASRAYKYYGGIGIKICDRWLKFENFLFDMGDKPQGMCLSRIDKDGDFTPDNCIYTTRKQAMQSYRWLA